MALDQFIHHLGLPFGKRAWKQRRIRALDSLEAGSSLVSPDTESPDTEIYNTLNSLRKKCETAAHQFLRYSWKYDGKELDDILRVMEKLYGNATDGDVGLGSLGAYSEKALVSADGEGAEKEPCEDDAGFGTESLEHGIKLIYS